VIWGDLCFLWGYVVVGVKKTTENPIFICENMGVEKKLFI
jgi:hypothetical protein